MDSITKDIDVEQLTTVGTEYGIKVLIALAIFVIGKWISKGIRAFLKRALVKAKADDIIVSFLGNIAYALLLSFVIIAALSQLGVETTSLAAIFAAAGLAIGLALQGSLSNLASGVMIVAFRPFKTGDFVEVSGTSGVVKEITIFTTVLKTGDNKTVIIPNGSVTSGNIINYSTEATRRIDLIFGCGYGDDLQKVKQVLTNVVTSDSRVLKDPAPTIAVSELADNSVNFVVRPWVKSEDYWAVLFDVTEKVKEAFDKEGLSIPYPQQDVYMHQVEAA